MTKRRAKQAATTTLPARRPSESAISEGNIAEYPIFVLNAHEAFPKRYLKTPDGKVDRTTGAKHEDDYLKLIEFPPDHRHGVVIERSLTIVASVHLGFPTMFAYRLLCAIIEEARNQGLLDAGRSDDVVVYVTRYTLAKRLGYATLGSKDYASIISALKAMKGLILNFKGTWYDKAQQRPMHEVAGVSFIADFQLGQEDGYQSALPLNDLKNGGRSYIQLGKHFADSIRRGYFFGVDLPYMNALASSPLAVRLYSYLTKKDLGSTYRENLRDLGQKLNLSKRTPSGIRDSLVPALNLLKSPIQVAGSAPPRQFLETWTITADHQLVATFLKQATSSTPADGSAQKACLPARLQPRPA
jgi:hypothetical protein